MKRILKILVIGLGVMVVLCTGADAAPRFNFEDNKYLEIFQMIQVWNAYTIDAEGWGVNYNIGMFDTNHEKIVGTDKGGKKWAPLYALRAAFTYGDPEMKRYRIGYNINYWGKRNGTTAAINYTYQGETDVFDKNSMLGFDILSNYGDFNFNAEYDLLSRDKVNNTHYTDRVWNIRAGYNIHLSNGHIIEPVVMYSGFEGDDDSTYYSKGEDRVTDIGVNWYINKKNLKLNLHYTISDGDAKSKYKDTTGKERGDFIGLGIQFII